MHSILIYCIPSEKSNKMLSSFSEKALRFYFNYLLLGMGGGSRLSS